MNEARARLLTSIFAVLGVSAAACGKTAVVAPDKPTDDPAACPSEKGHYAEWPNGKQPDMSEGMNDVCLPKPANGKCESYPSKCVLSRYRCGLAQGGEQVLDKLPTKEPDTCCWKVKGACAVGRPFIVAGEVRLAPLASRDDWRGDRTDTCELHAALAEVWARDGLTEHASVASFAQLVLELLALGAPADLVRGAQEAMADEIRHAERAFALASRHAGHAIGPGPLDVRGVGTTIPELADFAARAASEGCIAETIAALQLHAAADATSDPALAALLRTTANEEAVHATLAYRIVAWAIDEGGTAVRESVARVFANAADHVGFGPCPEDGIDLRAHGVLSRRERHDLAVAALQDVIAPAGSALLGARERSSSRPRPGTSAS
jgi:hypothetical protein